MRPKRARATRRPRARGRERKVQPHSARQLYPALKIVGRLRSDSTWRDEDIGKQLSEDEEGEQGGIPRSAQRKEAPRLLTPRLLPGVPRPRGNRERREQRRAPDRRHQLGEAVPAGPRHPRIARLELCEPPRRRNDPAPPQ